MNRLNNIYLIGPMGAGKSTVGRQLAKFLDLPFFDSDKIIEEKTGVDIPTIFEFEGESGFRKREQNAIKELTKLKGIVLATGGGVVLNEQNRKLLKQNGFVVYLKCSVDILVERTRKDTQRPLLQTENPRKKIEELVKHRDPLYLSCADFIVDAGQLKSRLVINRVLKKYKSLLETNYKEDENVSG